MYDDVFMGSYGFSGLEVNDRMQACIWRKMFCGVSLRSILLSILVKRCVTGINGYWIGVEFNSCLLGLEINI